MVTDLFQRVFQPQTIETGVCSRARLMTATMAAILWLSLSAPGFSQEPLSVSGITAPIRDVTLNATVDANIARIRLKEGTAVKAGQVILELDSRFERLEVQRRRVIWESKAELASAMAQVTALKGLLDSTRQLYDETQSVSKDELIRLELEYNIAVAEQQRLEVTEIREKIEYEMALQNFEKRQITSPIRGTVIKLFLQEGESCELNEPLVRIVDTSRCLFICNMEEWAGRRLKKGQTVDLRIRTGNDTISKKSRVVFAAPVVDPASGLLEVKTEFDNANGAVRPGIDGTMLIPVQ
jgi:RND family efflux transporter MFP subunit